MFPNQKTDCESTVEVEILVLFVKVLHPFSNPDSSTPPPKTPTPKNW